jgi:aspartyl/asparaginyl beta-hydroxylase (cupin superfamily)
MVYDNDKFVYKTFIDGYIPKLREEFLSNDFSNAPLYPAGTYAKLDIHQKWKMIAVKNMGEWDPDNKSKYPLFTSFIESFGEKCRGAGFSILEPGGEVLSHTDTEEDHERYVIVHVPLIVPDGDVGLTENDERTTWVEGSSFILDVESPHSIWNFTSESRVVILLELLKEYAYDC